MFKKFLLLIAFVVSFDAYARASSVPLVEPAPIIVPAATTSATVEKAIIGSGLRRNWTVVERQSDAVTLRYTARGFSVTVKVLYSASNVIIKYVDSVELGYEMDYGQPVIHPNYNRWVNNLAHDISLELSLSSIK
ncbi:hypothetical protein [Stenotrophobium rhamnosiphilum]|uniref:Uncharacterized protein n=1 Tax=Stenotrophobium rhamnosiphilum TaxID=2029166 RepID=A0A2T5MFQ3_9GAMM|nr:hypothetical protein [Stenotrophobium rhamnosiphilum]PTU31408.1 hypothetical protein CJD38_08680 [Stenotrophobium rhamnosiphilum]